MTTNIIKMILAYRGMTTASLAKKLETSPPNLSQKFKRDNFSQKELQEIADALDCTVEIKFTDKETGKEF